MCPVNKLRIVNRKKCIMHNKHISVLALWCVNKITYGANVDRFLCIKNHVTMCLYI